MKSHKTHLILETKIYDKIIDDIIDFQLYNNNDFRLTDIIIDEQHRFNKDIELNVMFWIFFYYRQKININFFIDK